jgi:hypothetical protein
MVRVLQPPAECYLVHPHPNHHHFRRLRQHPRQLQLLQGENCHRYSQQRVCRPCHPWCYLRNYDFVAVDCFQNVQLPEYFFLFHGYLLARLCQKN